jgi:hypothetical protein
MNEREVLSLKRQLEEDYHKNTEAIDRVLRLLREKKEAAIAGTGESSSSGTVDGTNNGRATRVRGVLALVEGFLKDLPEVFTRDDAFNRLKEVAPDKALKLNPASMRNTLRYLIKTEKIEVVDGASGSKGASYRIKAGVK